MLYFLTAVKYSTIDSHDQSTSQAEHIYRLSEKVFMQRPPRQSRTVAIHRLPTK